jgi:hypothetical protein
MGPWVMVECTVVAPLQTTSALMGSPSFRSMSPSFRAAACRTSNSSPKWCGNGNKVQGRIDKELKREQHDGADDFVKLRQALNDDIENELGHFERRGTDTPSRNPSKRGFVFNNEALGGVDFRSHVRSFALKLRRQQLEGGKRASSVTYTNLIRIGPGKLLGAINFARSKGKGVVLGAKVSKTVAGLAVASNRLQVLTSGDERPGIIYHGTGFQKHRENKTNEIIKGYTSIVIPGTPLRSRTLESLYRNFHHQSNLGIQEVEICLDSMGSNRRSQRCLIFAVGSGRTANIAAIFLH